jgi:alpha-galactosidase
VGGGELLLPGEISLGPAEEYATPWLYASYGRGLDAMASRFHSSLRSLPGDAGGGRLRPVILNTWEAVYFNHEVNRRRILADRAAEVGVERLVLDDGCFATGETCTEWSLHPRTTLSSRWLQWRRGSLRHLDA